MWECGVAEDPASPDTKVIVLQCLEDRPAVYEGRKTVEAWHEDSILDFAKQFTVEGFFPGASGRVTEHDPGDDELVDAAKTLHKRLGEAIRKQQTENWSAWPFLRIRLASEEIDRLKGVEARNRVVETRGALLEKAIVVDSSSGTAGIFGRSDLPSGMLLGKLVSEWAEHYPDRCAWLDVIARQVIEGARRQRPFVETWERFRHVGSDQESAPGVGRIKSDREAMQFDITFFGLARVRTVGAAMTPFGRIIKRDLGTVAAKEIRLQELLRELERYHWHRIPILDERRPKYIVHVSMIDRFYRERLFAGEDITDLTLDDLLHEKAMGRMFAETWSVVRPEITVADAQRVMREKENCLDLFVTEGGGRNEPALGWLTDRDIANELKRR
jgi:hypothetical protein